MLSLRTLYQHSGQVGQSERRNLLHQSCPDFTALLKEQGLPNCSLPNFKPVPGEILRPVSCKVRVALLVTGQCQARRERAIWDSSSTFPSTDQPLFVGVHSLCLHGKEQASSGTGCLQEPCTSIQVTLGQSVRCEWLPLREPLTDRLSGVEQAALTAIQSQSLSPCLISRLDTRRGHHVLLRRCYPGCQLGRDEAEGRSGRPKRSRTRAGHPESEVDIPLVSHPFACSKACACRIQSDSGRSISSTVRGSKFVAEALLFGAS